MSCWCPDRNRNRFWDDGVQTRNVILAVIYAGVTLVPLVILAWHGPFDWMTDLSEWQRLGLLALGLVVSCGPPVWYWHEANNFHTWVHHKYGDQPSEFARHSEYFRIQVDYGKTFWASILAVYAAALFKFGG